MSGSVSNTWFLVQESDEPLKHSKQFSKDNGTLHWVNRKQRREAQQSSDQDRHVTLHLYSSHTISFSFEILFKLLSIAVKYIRY